MIVSVPVGQNETWDSCPNQISPAPPPWAKTPYATHHYNREMNHFRHAVAMLSRTRTNIILVFLILLNIFRNCINAPASASKEIAQCTRRCSKETAIIHWHSEVVKPLEARDASQDRKVSSNMMWRVRPSLLLLTFWPVYICGCEQWHNRVFFLSLCTWQDRFGFPWNLVTPCLATKGKFSRMIHSTFKMLPWCSRPRLQFLYTNVYGCLRQRLQVASVVLT